VFLNYILHWGALRFYALLKGALTEKSLRKAALADCTMDLQPAGLVLAAPVSSISHSEVGKQEKAEREGEKCLLSTIHIPCP